VEHAASARRGRAVVLADDHQRRLRDAGESRAVVVVAVAGPSGSRYGRKCVWSSPGPPCRTISGKPSPTSCTNIR
jgi:hypothetical protein